jgi:hypothetical protein
MLNFNDPKSVVFVLNFLFLPKIFLSLMLKSITSQRNLK